MRVLVLFLIRLYKRLVSPLLVSLFGHTCRFQPTCSEYMYQAVERHGIIDGLPMGVKRIIRCHPWSEGGADPVR